MTAHLAKTSLIHVARTKRLRSALKASQSGQPLRIVPGSKICPQLQRLRPALCLPQLHYLPRKGGKHRWQLPASRCKTSHHTADTPSCACHDGLYLDCGHLCALQALKSHSGMLARVGWGWLGLAGVGSVPHWAEQTFAASFMLPSSL